SDIELKLDVFNMKKEVFMRKSSRLHHGFIVLCVFMLSAGHAAAQDDSKLWKEPDAAAKPLVDLPGFSGIVDKLTPAVVSFYVTTEVDMSTLDPMFKFFKDYFKQEAVGSPQPFTQKGVGSGIIINEDGYILTNHHVVQNVKSIKVVLENGDKFEGEVVGSDEATELALVKINVPYKLQPATLGDSDKSKIGDWVIAIGNPFGLEASVTVGIVSAIGRHEIGPPQLRYQDMIQTDAPINPGNSGGPLVDLSGNVVGIATAITASGQGIGFAIPINMAKTILPHLLDKGMVPRSWLGVTVQTLSDLLADSFGLTSKEGALISDVHEGSPAWTTGLKPGDVILELDGEKITTPDKLSWYASTAGANKKVTMKIWREGKEKELTLKLAPMPDYFYGAEPKAKLKTTEKKTKKSSPAAAPVTVDEIDKYTASKLGLEAKGDNVAGVIVTSVDKAGYLGNAGIDKGDIIVEINGEACYGPADFHKKVKMIKKGGIMRLYVISKAKRGFIALKK
ncbi:MAG: Do family serine endopeptidase, partial [Pseudomonadota bacterium]